MDRYLYRQAVTANKPTRCALIMIDSLVPKDVLARSTVLGNKEFLPNDPEIMNAIRGNIFQSISTNN